MRFLTLLESGATVEATARDFVKELLQRSGREGNFCLDVAADFINECFSAIGFSVRITKDDIDTINLYEWPMDVCRVYTFAYNKVTFATFKKFLIAICDIIEIRQEDHVRSVLDDNGEFIMERMDDDCPLDMLICLMGAWYNTTKSLLQSISEQPPNVVIRFDEPMSHINLHLLIGMHKLRKIYSGDPTIPKICQIFLVSAIKGLYYPSSLHIMFDEITKIFNTDFHIFHQFSPVSMRFYYHVFCVEGQTRYHTRMFTLLKDMLEKYSDSGDKLTILTDFLIEEDMLKVYYTTLVTEKGKLVLAATLQFLYVLQSKLPSLDCFRQNFLNRILSLVTNKDSLISDMAAKTFIEMARKHSDDESIFKLILDFYLNSKYDLTQLMRFIAGLSLHFGYMQDLSKYLDIITNTETDSWMRVLCAQILRASFKFIWECIEEPNKKNNSILLIMKDQVVEILKLLPNILTNLTCQRTGSILLQIFKDSDYNLIEKHTSRYVKEDILDLFEKYASKALTENTNLQQSFLIILFTGFDHCLKHTNNWVLLELLSVNVLRCFENAERQLDNLLSQKKRVTNSEIQHYNCIVQKLNIIIHAPYEIFDSMDKIYKMLLLRLLDPEQIYAFTTQANNFLDINIIEIIVVCLVKLHKGANALNEDQLNDITKDAKVIEQHLIKYFVDIEALPKMPIVRLKTIFNHVLYLYIAFSNTHDRFGLKLKTDVYHMVIETFLLINFKTRNFNTHCDDLRDQVEFNKSRTIEYQRYMFHGLIRLHGCNQVQLPSMIIWRICIYYGLPGHQYNEELKQLLKQLATTHFNVYKHVLPVLVTNLYKHIPVLRETAITNAIKAHKTLIDKELNLENPALFNVHIVLTILQIVYKTLSVVPIKTDKNRVASLKHLYIFLCNLGVNAENGLNDLLTNTRRINESLLTAQEQRSAKYFEDFLNKY